MWNKTLIPIMLLLILAAAVTAYSKTDWIPRMVSNTAYCKDDCALTLTLCNPTLTTKSADFTYEVIDLKTKQLGTTSENIKWLNYTWTEQLPVLGMTERNYTCAQIFTYDSKTKMATCSKNDVNGTNIIFQRETTHVTAKTAYWNEETIVRYDTAQHSEIVGETDKLKNLRVSPALSSLPSGTCADITITGSLREYNDAVDLIPSWGGFTFPEYAIWNSTLFNMTAIANYTNLWQGGITSGEGLFYAARDNCTNNNFTSGSMNVSCYDNLVKRLLTGTDGSDIDFRLCDTNETLNFTRINFTGLSNWSLYNNLTNNVSQDAWRVWGINQSTNLSNVCVALNGTKTTSTNADVNTDLVGWWEFEPSLLTNGQLLDLSGNGNTLTNAGGVTFWQNSSCSYGSNYSSLSCGNFNHSVTSYLNVVSLAGDELNQQVMTVSIWANPRSASQNTAYISKYGTTTAVKSWVIGYSGIGTIGFGIMDGGGTFRQCNVAESVNVWTQYAMTYDGSILIGYKNGINVCNVSFATGIKTNNKDVWVGSYYDTSATFDGLIDSVMIYNRSLSATEIRDAYRQGAHLPQEFYNLTTIGGGGGGNDTTPPTINWVEPIYADGTNLTNTTDSYFHVYFTTNESGNCSWHLNSTVLAYNGSVVASTNTSFNVSMPADGSYVYWIECNDSSNNTGYSSNMSINIDTTPPTVTLVSPADGSVLNSLDVIFSYNVTDFGTGVAGCLLVVNDDVMFFGGLTLNNSITQIENNFSMTLPVIGSYNWSVWCEDYPGNMNITPDWYFSITCVLNTTLCNGCRYQSTNQTISLICTGVPTTACYYSINDFLTETISNCSNTLLVLEHGWNRINLTLTSNSTNTSTVFNVWAKGGSWTDLLPAYVVGLASAIIIIVGVITGFFGFFVLAGVLCIVLAYELIAFSMAAAALCLGAGFGLLIKGCFVK